MPENARVNESLERVQEVAPWLTGDLVRYGILVLVALLILYILYRIFAGKKKASDIIKFGDLYYVWYSKGPQAHGYNATIWYATSPDGHAWTEKGEAVPRGPVGSWDEQSVFTPNILVAEGRYWLFYTAVPKPFVNSGPKTITRSILYAEDGLHFSKTHDVVQVPTAAGAYRPEAFTDSGAGEQIQWGVHIGKRKGFLPFVERFELVETESGIMEKEEG